MSTSKENPGRRFSYWLALTLREQRELAGVRTELIAGMLGVVDRTIKRLEDTGEEGYSQDMDRAIAAYAFALGMDDARELWQMALDRWRREGAAPDFSEELPGARFVRALREEGQRRRLPRADPQERPSSRRTRREAH